MLPLSNPFRPDVAVLDLLTRILNNAIKTRYAFHHSRISMTKLLSINQYRLT